MLFQSQSGAILHVLFVDLGHLAEETALVGVGRKVFAEVVAVAGLVRVAKQGYVRCHVN